MKSIYGFSDYKLYLNEKLDEMDLGGRGARARMSRAINCQTAYTARVLRGDSHFSLEQGEGINEFLGHTEDHGHYFLLLIQLAKAGNAKLRSRFQKLVKIEQENRSQLKNRLESSESIDEKERIQFYSSWIYAAAHALISIPEFQSAEKISQRLRIPPAQAASAIEFLINAGLLKRQKNGQLIFGPRQTHLGSDSPLISKHHSNWRLQAIRHIEENPQEGLHYSSVVTLSKKDFLSLKEDFIEMIRKSKAIIKNSKEEELCCFSMDFFAL